MRERGGCRALENVDTASTFIRQPMPASCKCSPSQWALLQSVLTAVYAGIGSDIGGERGAFMIREAVAISEEVFSRSTDKSSRAMWAQSQGMIGLALIRPNGDQSKVKLSDVHTAVAFMERALARVSRE